MDWFKYPTSKNIGVIFDISIGRKLDNLRAELGTLFWQTRVFKEFEIATNCCEVLSRGYRCDKK